MQNVRSVIDSIIIMIASAYRACVHVWDDIAEGYCIIVFAKSD